MIFSSNNSTLIHCGRLAVTHLNPFLLCENSHIGSYANMEVLWTANYLVLSRCISSQRLEGWLPEQDAVGNGRILQKCEVSVKQEE